MVSAFLIYRKLQNKTRKVAIDFATLFKQASGFGLVTKFIMSDFCFTVFDRQLVCEAVFPIEPKSTKGEGEKEELIDPLPAKLKKAVVSVELCFHWNCHLV